MLRIIWDVITEKNWENEEKKTKQNKKQ